MKHRLRRVGVLKAALVGGITYAILSLVFVPFFFMMALLPGPTGMQEDWMFGPAFALLLPVLYSVMGFIGFALMAFIYNLVAMMIGGLEIELEPVGDPPVERAPGY